MTLSDLSIKNPVFAWMLMAALIIFGIISYNRLGVGQLPDVDFPIVSISMTWEGAAPEVMETDVVDVVEDALMGIQGVKEISSAVHQGSAGITVEFDLGKDIDVAVQDVQNKIDQAQRSLPKDIDPAIVNKVNPDDHPILILSVSSPTRPIRDIMTYVQDHLKNQFATINGVGDIFLGGFVERNLRIWVDANKLEAYQLTVGDVVDAVKAEHEEVPAGRIETSEKEFNVRVMGEAATTKDFENLLIPKRSGQPIFRPIYLKEVATIEDGLSDIRRIARSNLETTVGVGIRKQRGANEVGVANKVLERLKEIQKTKPKDINISVRYNATKFSEDSIRELIFTLILSAIVTSLICWLFLGSWSATLNILLAIPTSVLGTFIVIYFMGFTLNTFTVLGLSLAIGIVVDDAIMVLENIVRYRERGVDKVEAARRGARQITFAAIAATMALVAIFLPVAFMYGIIGKFFYQYGVTISVAVALSLLEALTLAPMRCSQFLEVGTRHTFIGRSIDEGFKRLSASYHRTLEKVLRKRVLVVLVAIAFFISSLLLLLFIRKEFLPSQDMSMLMLRLQTPVGSSITFTDEHFKKAEAFLMNRPEVISYFALIGSFGGGMGGGEVNSGMMFITFKEPKKRPVVPPNKHSLSQAELMTLFRTELNKIPDLKVVVQDLSLSGFSAQRGMPVELSVRGPDWEKLSIYSEEIRKKMEKSPLMIDVDTDYLAKIPEVRVQPDREKADDRGVSVSTIGSTINSLIGGERIAKYTKDGRRYDVRIRLVPSQRTALEDIDRLWVWNNRNELVQLKNVIKITEKPTPLTITRRNRERAISLFANVAQGKSQTDALKEVEKIVRGVLPEGYRAVFSGSTQTFKESFGSLLLAFWLGILIAYMVLASQFNSYLHPFSVLFALPFSISGALIALMIFNQSLNIYSIIGLILLMGIVKKNSILLVDFTNQQREQGLEATPALLSACPTRLRPILMTSVATIAAAVPPALAIGPGAETRIPMAVTIIGGVILSTLLTLFVVPSVYSLFSKIERKKYQIEFKDLDDHGNSVEKKDFRI
ncbi:MAG: efflux RND transporter permease subunit [Candidatus Omnitrophota bacterium]|nr:efflux RND transporter permease subunit [Candidatus Omnitrophota bacterium]